MNLKSKTALSSIMFTVICIAPFISQTKLDFYGVVSPDADKNMLSMTEDLYLAQLKDMPVNLSDKRSDFFSQTYISEGNADFLKSENGGNAFYVAINKLPDGKWQCSINLKNLDDGKSYSKIKEYDSYYKILMESKTSLKELISGLIQAGSSGGEQANVTSTGESSGRTNAEVSTQSIAGTWGGETYIDKIIILRGGRGFVIFKNGASMNVNVAISGNAGDMQINVRQTGGSNASYFPDIPRDTALKAAADAAPIEWDFRITKDGTLSGVKKTLVLKDDSAAPVQAEIPVEWKRL